MAPLRRLAAFLLVLSLAATSVPAQSTEPSAKQLYNRGRKYEKTGDFANAYLLYSQAAAADPGKREYWQRAQALRRKAATAANVLPPSASTPIPEDDAPPLEPPSPEDLQDARRPQPPTELTAADYIRDFDLRSDGKALWEQVAKAYALEVVFDGDFQPGPVQKFQMSAAGYREALNALMTATGTFIVPISSKLFMVVKDTEAKRREVENTVAVSIPIPAPVTIQEAQELARTVQQIMEIQRFAIDSSQRMAVFRDRASKVRPAQLLFQQLMTTRTQVAFEVEMLTASKSSTIGLGLNLPTEFSLVPLTKTITLTGGPLSFALGIVNAHLIARATKTNSKTLYRALIRTGDSQPAQLHVGEKYPIMNLAYIGEVPPGEQVYTPPPSFNFEDLGFVLKLTPKIHDRNEVTIEVEAEFKVLGAGSLNGIPVIANRKFAGRARLRFDEAAVISGLVTENDVRTLAGPAGLINIPVLGPLLGEVNRTKDDVQLLLVVKPRLLSMPPSEFATREIWLGTESRPRIPL